MYGESDNLNILVSSNAGDGLDLGVQTSVNHLAAGIAQRHCQH
jgi:hypothetical protein